MKERTHNHGLDVGGLPLVMFESFTKPLKALLLPDSLGIITILECKGNERLDHPNNDQPVVEGWGSIYRKGEEVESP